MSGWRRWNSSTMRILRSRSSGLAAKKKVNASSSGAQPAAQGASDAAGSAPAPRSRLRRPNGLSSMALPMLPGGRRARRLSSMSLVPDGAVVLLRWPTLQRENGPAQPVGIAGDVDAVNAVVDPEADPQQGLRGPVGRDHDARGTVDEQDGTGPRAPGEALDDLEALGRTARRDGRTGVQSAAGPACELLRGGRRPVQE